MKKKSDQPIASASAGQGESEAILPDESASLEPIDWKQVCKDAETFVREHPAAAVVIAASVGFVVGRMFR